MSDTPVTPPEPPPTTPPPAQPQTDPAIVRDVADLRARLDQLAAQKPQSLAEQIAELERLRTDAIDRRQEGKEVANATDAEIAKLRAELRNDKVIAAARAAGFHDPALAVPLVAEGADPVEAVATIAKERPYLIRQAAPSPPIGAPGGGQGGVGRAMQMDPGLAELAKVIEDSRG